jgi:hypothetical protein
LRFAGQVVLAHRVAYYIARNLDPGNLDVCHTCDRPICCNPDHLFLGEHVDNMQDGAKKGRFIKKLTSSQVTDIRTLHNEFSYSQAKLGKLFGVSNGFISLIVRHRKWQFCP